MSLEKRKVNNNMSEQNRQFKGIWIPKEIWENKELSILEKIILIEIDSLEDEERGCFASNRYFADFFGLSMSRVSQIINNLKEKNYIDINIIYDGKQIKERQLKIKRPPYPDMIQGVFRKLKGGIKFSKGGYLENCKENNIYINNINNNNNNIYNNNIAQITEITEKFEEFYKSYPRKVSKENVKKWFNKNKPNDELFEIIMTSLEKYKKSKQWKDKQYIPYPSTWLNQKRWEDEIEEEKTSDEIWKEIENELKEKGEI